MAQIWAALKSLGIIAELLRDLIAWINERARKQKIDEADAKHDENKAAIDRAFHAPDLPDGVPLSDDAKPRPAPLRTPPI